MTCLAACDGAARAPTVDKWLGIIGAAMDRGSQIQLVQRVKDPDDPLTGLGLVVLANLLSEKALGIPLPSASILASTILNRWFMFNSWCITKGVMIDQVPLHHLFPAMYGFALSNCGKQEEIDRLNRQVFGTARPW